LTVITGNWFEFLTGAARRRTREFDKLSGAIPPRRPFAPTGTSTVAYVLSSSLPYSTSGYSTRTHGIAKALRNHGLNVVCVTRPGYPPSKILTDKNRHLGSLVEIDGVPYHSLHKPHSKGRTIQAHVEEASYRLGEFFHSHDVGVVLAASAAYNTALPALIAARRAGLPFFYEVRGLWEITRASRQPSFARSATYHFRAHLEALVCSHADHVFTLNEPLKEELVRRGVDPQKITLVPNCYEPADAGPQLWDRDVAAQLGLHGNEIVIGYAGTFMDYEGLDDLVLAAALLKNRGLAFKLLLVGAEPERERRGSLTLRLRRLVEKHGLGETVILPGKVPFDQVSRYYSVIDIAPFPRKPLPVCEMVSPIKPLEAMATGKAVVVSSVRALAEMVDHGNTGLVFKKGSVEDLARVLHELVGNAELRQRLGRAAQAHVAKHRNWAITTQAFSRHFLKATSGQ
jgi:glycosyltransferase involved in cell wall biosynthesis